MAEVELLEAPGDVAEPAAESSVPEPEQPVQPEPEAELQHVEEPQPSEEELLEGWIQRVGENSRTLAEVPSAHRSRVIDELRGRDKTAYESSAAQLYQEALEIGRRQALAEIWVSQKDELLDEDSPSYNPGEFASWRKQAPDEYRAYMAFKANQPATGVDQSLDGRVDAVWADLRQYPEAMTAVGEQLRKTPLTKDAAGVAQLEKLANRQIGMVEARKGSAATIAAVQQRAKQAEHVTQLARPPGGNSVASGRKQDVKEALRSSGYEAGVRAFREKHGIDPP